MIRVLVYNWVPFDETELKGGGVTVYTRSLIDCLCRNSNYDVYFLSSGRAYNREHANVYVEETGNVLGFECRTFQVVNSPVLSSAAVNFPYIDKYLYDFELKNVLRDFISEYKFNVIHFQNIEGLSLGVFELKEEFPDIKFIYSVHNYYCICPQVMLWENDDRCCRHSDCGEYCLSCMNTDVFDRKVRVNQEINYRQRYGYKVGEKLADEQKYLAKFYDGKNILEMQSNKSRQHLIASLSEFRKSNVEYINRYFDVVLAVSRRVAEIIISAGVDSDKVYVNYIGTKIAERQFGRLRNIYNGGIFHLCYLGYMRKMKGFYFLLDALEKIPGDMAQGISVTFATVISDDSVKNRLIALDKKFASIDVINGYTHEELPDILKDIHLGIVPPLWEDNLPQVAIEFKASGVPVLCSDMGGTKELAGDSAFIFRAGDTNDFIYKLGNIVNNPDIGVLYWENTGKLVTMDEHIREIDKVYTEG